MKIKTLLFALMFAFTATAVAVPEVKPASAAPAVQQAPAAPAGGDQTVSTGKNAAPKENRENGNGG